MPTKWTCESCKVELLSIEVEVDNPGQCSKLCDRCKVCASEKVAKEKATRNTLSNYRVRTKFLRSTLKAELA